MAFVTIHGASSLTFKAPPTDGSLTLVEMFEYHAINSPNHPLFRYENTLDGSLQDITWSDGVLGIQKTARRIQTAVSDPNDATNSPIVIAILAAIDSLNYAALIMSIMRAGHIPFPISLRNSPAAVANLIAKTNCKFWFVSEDATTQKLVKAATAQLDGHQITHLTPIRFSDLLSGPPEDPLPAIGPLDLDQACIIHHSSGSTSLPKPITITQRMVLPYGYGPYFGEVDWCGLYLSAHGLPMFHMMGFLAIPWATMTGITPAFFAPNEQPIVPSPTTVMEAIISCQCRVMLTVPAFLEAWAKDPRSVEELQKFKSVQVSGGPLQPETGDYLAAQGVNVVVAYGMTEMGVGSLIVPKKVRKEGWIWLKTSPHVDIAFLPVEDDENLSRLVFKKCATHVPAVLNTTVDGVEAFDSNDLVIRHPTDPNLWKIHGRDDDQITHSTGEKTNPAPIEAILESDPRIAKAIMFGRSKFQAGVLVMPSPANVFDPLDSDKLADFRNKIWDTVTKANESAPRHSRLFKEMIVVAHPGKPFEFTAKGSTRRQANLAAYQTEIEAAYAAVDEISHSEIALPVSWTLTDVMNFIRAIVQDVIDPKLQDSDDIFLNGGDSLSATSIRSSIQRALQKSKRVPVSAIRALPANFVFDLPTIAGLGAFVYGVFVVSSGIVDLNASDDDTEEIFDWGSVNPNSTIVKLRKGKGETPLIILHGVAGSVVHFQPFQEKFRSALWAIQITPETPLTTIQEQAAFYYRKIKEELPHGPYRLASFSASSFLLVQLTLLLEGDGEQVTQMAMLDHFPTTTLPLVSELEKLDPNDPESRRVFTERGFKVIDTQLLQEDGGLFPNREESAQQLRDVSDGKLTSPAIQLRWDRMQATLLQMLDFIASLSETPQTVEEAKASMFEWMKKVKAPVSVYVASNGMVDCLPEGIREEWQDLGARECYPNVEIVNANGGHFQILTDDGFMKALQNGYI